jgi:hypothetical protein
MNWVNSLNDGDKWILCLLAVAMLGVFVALRFASRHVRRNAAAKFRTSVQTTLSDLYLEPVNWPADVDQVLRRLFPALQTAVTEFWPFIPSRLEAQSTKSLAPAGLGPLGTPHDEGEKGEK